jgi:hypothetical protein
MIHGTNSLDFQLTTGIFMTYQHFKNKDLTDTDCKKIFSSKHLLCRPQCLLHIIGMSLEFLTFSAASEVL